ncbi:MAG: hypothetical protein QM737_12755 [Ferruginibacter sp.]
MMILQEYFTAKDLALQNKVSVRHIRHIIEKLKETATPQLIWKDKNGRYMVHHILSSKFKPVRNLTSRYYALTINPTESYSEPAIHNIMGFVADRMEGADLEINYSIEKKKATGINHLHCYIKCNQKRKLLEYIRDGFFKIQYHETEIFDLSTWKKYITKTGSKITTIKNN